jgi:4-aminobutyrate aminotransferase-like enzyme
MGNDMAGQPTYLTRNVRPRYAPLVAGRGLWIRNAEGRTLLDLGSQTSNLSLGQSHPSVAQAAASQVEELVFASSSFSSRPYLELSKRLISLAPDRLTACNLMMCDGSDAVETACKIARLYRWSSEILAVRGAWHGETVGTLSFSSAHKDSLLGVDRSIVLSREASLDSLADLVESRPDAAAVIIDPIGVSNGLFPRSDMETYLPRIRTLCTERDQILIFDEVQTFGGFMGSSLFASQDIGVTPDVLCIAKAIGGGLPLAGALCREDLSEILSHNEAEFTNGGNPVSCAAAIAFLDVYESERDRFERNAKAYQEALHGLAQRFPDLEFRNYGFIATFRKREDRFREVWAACAISLALDEGIILRVTDLGQSILVKPPIVIDPETSESAAQRLAAVFDRALERTAQSGISISQLRSRLTGTEQSPPQSMMEHFSRLLPSIDPQCRVRSRSPREIELLTCQLPRIGVRVSRAFAVTPSRLEYEATSGTSLDSYIDDKPALSLAVLNGLLCQYQRSLESAHANGIIIGGRWPRNVLVGPDSSLRFIDFEVAYSGPFETLAAFERIYALFEFAAHIHDPDVRAAILKRTMPALFLRYAEASQQSWRGIRAFFLAEPELALPLHLSMIQIIDRMAVPWRELSMA